MSRDLEYGVGRGVDDQVAGAHMLLAEFVNDGGAAPWRVGQNPTAGGSPEGRQHFLGEAIRIRGQRIGRDQACDLPVADGGILSHALLRQTGDCANVVRFWQAGYAVDAAKADADHIGNVQISGSGAGGQRIDAHITELLRIRHLADAEGVQHKQKYSFHS